MGLRKKLSNWVRKSERENIWIVKLSETNVEKNREREIEKGYRQTGNWERTN